MKSRISRLLSNRVSSSAKTRDSASPTPQSAPDPGSGSHPSTSLVRGLTEIFLTPKVYLQTWSDRINGRLAGLCLLLFSSLVGLQGGGLEKSMGYGFMGGLATFCVCGAAVCVLAWLTQWGLGLKQKRDLNSLVSAENSDREKLYDEIAKALKIDPSQVNRVREIFAKEWQKPVR